MSDIHALSGAYAVDALDDVERARFERHLAECADCRAEVASLSEATALLAETTSATPPPSLRDRILDDVASVRPLPPIIPAAVARRANRRSPLALVAAAAALIVLGGAAATVWHPWADESSQSDLTATERVLTAPDAEPWRDRLEDGGTVTVVRSKSLNEAIVQMRDLEPPGEGLVYQLWLQHGDQMVSAGLVDSGTATVVLEGDPDSAIGFGITREQSGGSPTGEPTKPPVSLIDFEQA